MLLTLGLIFVLQTLFQADLRQVFSYHCKTDINIVNIFMSVRCIILRTILNVDMMNVNLQRVLQQAL